MQKHPHWSVAWRYKIVVAYIVNKYILKYFLYHDSEKTN